MRSRVLWLLLALCVPTVPAANAQVPFDQSDGQESGHATATVRPRVEFGVHGGLATFASGAGVSLALGGLRVTANVTRRDAVELSADLVTPVEGLGVQGLYLLHYKRFLKDGNHQRNALFLIVGTSGGYRYYRAAESRQERPDGSIVIRPAFRYAEMTAPLALSGGIGIERAIAPHAAFRAEVHALVPRFATVGVRGVVGVSIPFGSYRVPQP